MAAKGAKIKSPTMSSVYEFSTFMEPPMGGWLATFDCLSRSLRVVMAFYALLVTQPISLFRYLNKFHKLFHWGSWASPIMMFFFPVWPFVMLATVAWQKLRDVIWPPKEINCFFTEPDGLFARWLWAFYMESSVPLAIFMIHGDSTAAVVNAWHDFVLTKPFWRRHMEKTGMPFPLQLGCWDGAECDWWARAKDKGADYQVGDIVLKLMDGCLGRGDTFLEKGKDGFDGTIAAVNRVLEEKYRGTKGVLVLEWIRPAQGREVHSFDIVTMVTPDGSIQLVSCLYWGHCRNGGSSTHDSTAGFVIDVAKEEVIRAASWYSALFAESMGQTGPTMTGTGMGFGEVGIGSKFPGLQEVCEQAIAGHYSALEEQPWLHAIGWDAMFSTTGPIFFEGNYASHRIPRRVFLTWRSWFYFLWNSCAFASMLERRVTAYEEKQPCLSKDNRPMSGPLPLAVERAGAAEPKRVAASAGGLAAFAR
eukprot:TRINITY_DN1267_c0_g1_i7.p1 TRINITY_DN1267_c0_g1~~TRINITY_DN1267_c0_g1_i7.p1  ORF type:complete len:476 (+),score=68.33 TRINITY_DN1267_c0_g1_i7:178-1605(+)